MNVLKWKAFGNKDNPFEQVYKASIFSHATYILNKDKNDCVIRIRQT